MSLEIKPTPATPTLAPIQPAETQAARSAPDTSSPSASQDRANGVPDFMGGESLEGSLGQAEMNRIQQVALGEQPAASPAAQEIRNIRLKFDEAAKTPAGCESAYNQLGGMLDGVLSKYATELKDPQAAKQVLGELQHLRRDVNAILFSQGRSTALNSIESSIRTLETNLPAESKPLPKTMDAHIPSGAGVFSANLFQIDADGKHLRQTPDKMSTSGSNTPAWSYDAHQRYEIQLGTKDGPKNFVFDPSKESPKNLWDLIQSHK